jgi:hypothetical protein
MMTMRALILMLLAMGGASAFSAMPGPYAPQPGTIGSTAVAYLEAEKDPRIVGWATGYSSFTAGPMSNQFPGGPFADWGTPANALGPSDGDINDTLAVVSLGDGGQVTLTFAEPFGDGPGPDLAVFENAFQYAAASELAFMELAFVEVSSDGMNFRRFPSISLTQTDGQIGPLGTLDTTYIHNLAGKFIRGYGTPFDLAELAGMDDLNINAITHVRIIDVVGSINPLYGRFDSQGNLINDPWFTNFDPEEIDYSTGGFDLDAVAILSIPEPAASTFCLVGLSVCATRRKRRS